MYPPVKSKYVNAEISRLALCRSFVDTTEEKPSEKKRVESACRLVFVDCTKGFNAPNTVLPAV